MSPDYRLQPKFPALKFSSGATFANFVEQEQRQLDRRYSFEIALCTNAPVLTRNGTCAPCLRPTVFTSDTVPGERLPDGRLIPNWREADRCNCDAKLTNRSRAVLHFIKSDIGLSARTRLLIFGPPSEIDDPLARSAGTVRSLSRLSVEDSGQGFRYRLDEAERAQHIVLCLDYLQHVPPLDDALAEIHRVLIPGGSFVFTIPFDVGEAVSASQIAHLPRFNGLIPVEIKNDAHRFGWDILDRLRQAGFTDAAAYLYWSAELGYLGPYNLIFRATR